MKRQLEKSFSLNNIDLEDVNLKAAIAYLLMVITFLLIFIAFKK